MKRSFELYLHDILERIERIHEFIGESDFDDFKENRLLTDGVVHNLEVIGEAVSQLDDTLKKKYPAVPWQDIKDFRNVMIHKYNKVDVDVVWDIIKSKLDDLEKQVREILRKER